MDTIERALKGANARWRDHKKNEWAVIRVPRCLLAQLQEIDSSKPSWQVIETLIKNKNRS